MPLSPVMFLFIKKAGDASSLVAKEESKMAKLDLDMDLEDFAVIFSRTLRALPLEGINGGVSNGIHYRK